MISPVRVSPSAPIPTLRRRRPEPLRSGRQHHLGKREAHDNVGAEGRKFITPEIFTQRIRGDYEYNNLKLQLIPERCQPQRTRAERGRNLLPTGRIDNLDLTAVKRFSFHERYKLEFNCRPSTSSTTRNLCRVLLIQLTRFNLPEAALRITSMSPREAHSLIRLSTSATTPLRCSLPRSSTFQINALAPRAKRSPLGLFLALRASPRNLR